MTDHTRPAFRPTGSRLVLVGAVLYLLEFVAIFAVDPGDLPAPPGTAAEEAVAMYAGEAGALGFMAGWFSIVLLGRVLVVVGIRSYLAATGHGHPLMDLAVAAMLLGVVLEVSAYGVATAAAVAADAGAVVALNAGATVLNSLIYGPTGVALLVTVWAMWRARAFPVVLHVLGLVAGVSGLAAGLATAPSASGVQEALSIGAIVMWVWMIWAGVVLWRRPRWVPPTASAG